MKGKYSFKKVLTKPKTYGIVRNVYIEYHYYRRKTGDGGNDRRKENKDP